MVRRADGKFRRPIAIDQFDIRPFAGQHFFTAHHDIAQRQVREAVHHLHANLRGEGHSCDAILFKVRLHAGQIPAKRFTQYMYLASQSQRTQEIVQRRVEGKAGMDRVDALPSDNALPPGDKGAQGTVALHDALGLSGGTGGIDHVGVALRPGPVDGTRPGTFGTRRLSIIGKDFSNQRFVQNQLRSGILQHVGNALFRIFRVYGHIGRPGLLDAKHSRDKRLHAPHADRDKAVRRHAVGNQVQCHPVRRVVKLRVGIAALAVHHGHVIRRLLHPGMEQCKPGLIPVEGQFFATGQLQKPISFLLINRLRVHKERVFSHAQGHVSDGTGHRHHVLT